MEATKALHTYDPVKGEWVEVHDVIRPDPTSSPLSEISWEETKRHNEEFLAKSLLSPEPLKKQVTVTDVDSLDEKGYSDYVQRKIDTLYDRDSDISALIVKPQTSHVIRVSSARPLPEDVKEGPDFKGYLAKKSPRFFVGWQVEISLIDSPLGKVLRAQGQKALLLRERLSSNETECHPERHSELGFARGGRLLPG